VPAQELARVILYGIKGFKEIARDVADMRLMVRALITTVSAALCPSEAIGRVRTKNNAIHVEPAVKTLIR
jgi:hypothetical protein